MPTAAIVSFRLGGSDGVSVEAAKWQWALGRLGFEVRTVAGHGPVDVLLPGLAMDAAAAPMADEVAGALGRADLVVVENLCSLPLNLAAAAVVAGARRGRPTVLHHHDLPWQRPRFAGYPPPPDDPAWVHVTVNDLSRAELASHGITSVTVHNTFDVHPDPGRRGPTRRALGVAAGERLVLQPTRALPRKNVGGGLAVAEALGATFWLLGPAEDGFGPELDRLLRTARCPVLTGPGRDGAAVGVVNAYAACDVVALPSTWEGFGNPAIESAVHRRPLAIGPYPVADELASFGFEWFPIDDPGRLRRWLDAPDHSLLDHNFAVAERSFNLRDLPDRLRSVLARVPGLAVPGNPPDSVPGAGRHPLPHDDVPPASR
jgi:glycosyltransferase involved in cell wall biosynthesis